MRIFLSLLVVMAVVGAAVLGLGAWENGYFAQPGPAPRQTIVIVNPGSSLTSIAEDLAKAGVVENSILFRLGVMRRGGAAALKAGEYAFPPQASEAQVLDMLVRRLTLRHRITIAEGLTSDAAAALIAADPVLTGDVAAVPEGTLLPETYLFERGATRADILARMQKAQTETLAQLWPARKEGLPFETQEEVLKLASIVEKETALPSERPRVAAVFINRLRRGMKLESDPTIIYGLTKGVALGHPLRQSELAKPNPYSTYQIIGLPPTPICNPGRASILAVLNPVESDELYFVADGNGGHAFAATMAEHLRNVARLRTLERTQSRN